MNREEAIGNLIHAIRWNDMPKKEALDMAIKALEQEPKTDRIEYGTDGNPYRLTISTGKEYEQEPKTDVLDKIRVEIENDWQLKKYPSSPFSCGLRRAIEIIDKYKAEGSDKE